MIKHLWLDFSGTLAVIDQEKNNKLRYDTYAKIRGKKVTPSLIEEYDKLYKENNNSNSAVFRSLGMPANYWSDQINSVNPGELYSLSDKNIPNILNKLKESLPISIFSNLNLEAVLPMLEIDSELFTHILSSDMVKEPKPSLHGFYKMIELSKVSPHEILYIGDHIGKDILPAKKAGIKTGLMWGHSDQADYSFEDFHSILSLFDK